MFYIKVGTNIFDYIDIISKMIFNAKYNVWYYNEQGEVTNNGKKFWKYETKDKSRITYYTMPFDHIHILIMEDSEDDKTFIKKKIMENISMFEKYTNLTVQRHHDTPYKYTALVEDAPPELHIQVSSLKGSKSLPLVEIDEHIHEDYIIESLQTIVIDNVDLLNWVSFTMYLDFPTLEEYNINHELFITTPLKLRQDFGLLEDFVQRLNKLIEKSDKKKKSQKSDFMVFSGEFRNVMKVCDHSYFDIESIDWKDVRPKRRDPSSDPDTLIFPDFNYVQQEKAVKNAYNIGKPICADNLCFVTGIPLFDEFLVIRFPNYDICINTVSLYCDKVYAKNIKSELNFIPVYIAPDNKDFDKVKVFKCKAEISYEEMLHKLDMDANLRKLYLACHNNNVFRDDNDNFIVVNEENEVFIGLPEMSGAEILHHKKNNLGVYIFKYL